MRNKTRHDDLRFSTGQPPPVPCGTHGGLRNDRKQDPGFTTTTVRVEAVTCCPKKPQEHADMKELNAWNWSRSRPRQTLQQIPQTT